MLGYLSKFGEMKIEWVPATGRTKVGKAKESGAGQRQSSKMHSP
jgi:hypothetical protein